VIQQLSLVKQVKAQLLPLSSWEALLEYVVELLPRHLLHITINTLYDIMPLNEGRENYCSLSETPYFELFIAPFTSGGWFYLEAAVVRHNGNRDASLFVELKDGTTEVIPIPSNMRGTIREVFFLPRHARTIRWSPTAAKGYFSQSSLLIHRISPLESILRRLYRVLFDFRPMRQHADTTINKLKLYHICTKLHKCYLKTARYRNNRLNGLNYASFISYNDAVIQRQSRRAQCKIKTCPHQPHISLIMLLDAPNILWLQEAIESCKAQVYSNWEILIVADSEGVKLFNQRFPAQQQVKSLTLIQSEDGNDLADMLNMALYKATGEYILRIGQHDRLSPHALLLMLQKLQKRPRSLLVYSDNDDIDHSGRRANPRCKPDWNPDLLSSCYYLGRPCLLQRERLLEIGGYRAGFTGAEEYDLCLRFTDGIQPNMIRHLPDIVYSRRVPSTKSMEVTAHRSGQLALQDFFANSGTNIEDGPALNHYRILHPLPTRLPLVSIIIPTRNQKNILTACIESIFTKTTYNNYEILIVDNQTTDPATLNYLKNIQHTRKVRILRHDAPFNYAAINNAAVKQARGEVLALLNNDVEIITTDWLHEMVRHCLRPKIGAVGAKLLYANNTIQHAGVILGLGGIAGHGHKYLPDNAPGYCHRAVVPQNYSAVTGACMVIRKTVYEKMEGLDEQFAVAFNDIDFCLRLLEQGYRNIFTPYAKLYHHESFSRGKDDTPEKQAVFQNESKRMREKWGPLLDRDPAYNPNLSLNFEGFTLKVQ